MDALLKTLSLLLVAAPVLAFAWAYGGARADALARVMPWASLVCAAGCLLLPQRHPGEGWGASVRRVLLAAVRDPFFWTALLLVAYLLMPLFNVALSPTRDAAAIDAGANPFPACRWLPFCVSAAAGARAPEHMGVVWWFVPALLTAFGVRRALSRAGKRAFLELLVWNAAALAVFGFVQAVTGAQFPYWETLLSPEGVPLRPVPFFSVFGYPNMGGAFFCFATALSLGIWCYRIGGVESDSMRVKSDRAVHPFLAAHYPVLAVALNLGAVIATRSRGAIILAAALVAIFVFYVLLRAFSGNDWHRGQRFRSAVTTLALLLGFLAAVYVYAPADVGRELRSLSAAEVASRVSGKAEYHTRVATTIMRDFPFFGVGGWGYRHFAPVYMAPEDLRRGVAAGGANVHNDYLQFLVEHGLVGFGLMVACVWLLMRPTVRVWKRLFLQALAAGRSGMGASSQVVFAVRAPVLWTFLGAIALMVHAFGDCPLRSAAVLSAFLAALPATFGYLPHEIEG